MQDGISNQSNPFFPDNISLIIMETDNLSIYFYCWPFFENYFKARINGCWRFLSAYSKNIFLEGGEMPIIISFILENGTAFRVNSQTVCNKQNQ